MNDLTKWMTKANTAQRERLAKKAKTSVAYLRQLANGHRKCGMELAHRLQKATLYADKVFDAANLPVIRRENLNAQWKGL